MGTTVNPNIFRLGKTKNWPSKYFAKKTTETSVYAFKNLEIRKFINKFFKDNGLTVNNCKINYSDDGSLHIFVSYYLTLKSLSLVNNLINEQKINLVKIRNRKSRQIKKKHKEITRSVRNYFKYQNIKSNRFLKQNVSKENRDNVITSLLRERQTPKIRRVRLLKSYKSFLTIKNFKKFDSIESNSFTTKFFNSIHAFLGTNIKIFLILSQLNKNIRQEINKDKIKFLKKSLIKLRKYKQNDFFKEGVNILFMSTAQQQTANLLTQFIATQLSKSKRHNFFLRFVKTGLTLLKNNKDSNLEGIKIKIKGRLNGRPRAKHKIITIGNGVPAITLNSKIDYSESVAYTSNGTLGVKVWVCHNI
jgi:ribosomal protein S3